MPFISSSVLLDCSLLVKSHHDLRKALEEFNAKGMPKARDMEESIAKKHVRRNPMNTLLQINVCSSSGDEGKEKLSDAVLPTLVVMQSRRSTNASFFENLPSHTNITTEALQAWSLGTEKTPPAIWGVSCALATGDTEFLARLCARVVLARCEFDFVCSLDQMSWVVEAGFEEYLACRQAVYEGGIVVGANMVGFKSGKVGKLGLPVVDEGRVLVVHEPDSRPFDFARSIPGAFPSVPTFDVSLTERATLPEKVGESEKWWSEERVGLKRQYVPDQSFDEHGAVKVKFASGDSIDTTLVVLSAVAVCPPRDLYRFRDWVKEKESRGKISEMVKVVLGRIVETISKSVSQLLPIGGDVAIFSKYFEGEGGGGGEGKDGPAMIDWDDAMLSVDQEERGFKECLRTYCSVVKKMKGVAVKLKGSGGIIFSNGADVEKNVNANYIAETIMGAFESSFDRQRRDQENALRDRGMERGRWSRDGPPQDRQRDGWSRDSPRDSRPPRRDWPRDGGGGYYGGGPRDDFPRDHDHDRNRSRPPAITRPAQRGESWGINQTPTPRKATEEDKQEKDEDNNLNEGKETRVEFLQIFAKNTAKKIIGKFKNQEEEKEGDRMGGVTEGGAAKPKRRRWDAPAPAKAVMTLPGVGTLTEEGRFERNGKLPEEKEEEDEYMTMDYMGYEDEKKGKANRRKQAEADRKGHNDSNHSPKKHKKEKKEKDKKREKVKREKKDKTPKKKKYREEDDPEVNFGNSPAW
ncbi:hypothetical protein TL16_g03741 [Triparma laevis f. inornata]|uniref:Uncharacterized protein n=1 Tax=Triparma laevis f. inornata TaxID=1714386 RepID=A0A9W7A6H2_9STRA|nr:hypothetical protein TL16_g03741 [Triparma laevis f. inornata]